jgi:hypothetical protein
MGEFDHALPVGKMPRGPGPGGMNLTWYDLDTEERYHENGGHPIYDIQAVKYHFNQFGYRGPEFGVDALLRVLAVGCSNVFGVGLAEEDVFHQRFQANLAERTRSKVVTWNLGFPGASNEYIQRMLHLAVPLLDPHIVLVNFTFAFRREYATIDGRLLGYNPGWSPHLPSEREIKGHMDELSSPYDDQLNLFRSYRAVECLLASRNWLFSTSDPETMDALGEHVDRRRYVGALMELDRARDHLHAGPKSHDDLARRFWQRYGEVAANANLGLGSAQTLALFSEVPVRGGSDGAYITRELWPVAQIVQFWRNRRRHRMLRKRDPFLYK